MSESLPSDPVDLRELPLAPASSRGPERAATLAGWLRRALLLATSLAALAFLLAAAARRLNFDESLALRAGWLLVEGVPAEPPFAMPVTLAIGALAHAVADPGALFVLLRSLAAGSVLLALAWMLRRARLGTAPALAAALVCLLQASFAVHAYEFRYDWAIVVGWMLAFGLLQRRAPRDFAALGLCVAWLAAHHLKGLVFAAPLYALAVGAVLVEREAARPKLAGLHAAMLGAGAAWVGLAAALGHGGELVALYASFAELGGAQEKVWPWSALGASFARDALWWGALLLALGLAPAALRARGARALRDAAGDPLAWALAFAAVPLAFLFVHPHPWPYMLAPAAPFGALLVVEGARRLVGAERRRAALLALGLAGALAAQGLGGGIWPGGPYAAALRASSAPQVATLRLLRRVARPGERVIDPSGLAYFQPPCTREWYVDTLFRSAAREGAWMRELGERSARECPWVLNTYRLGMLPEGVRERLPRGYVLLSGGLALARGDARLEGREGWPRLPHRELRSFWW